MKILHVKSIEFMHNFCVRWVSGVLCRFKLCFYSCYKTVEIEVHSVNFVL